MWCGGTTHLICSHSFLFRWYCGSVLNFTLQETVPILSVFFVNRILSFAFAFSIRSNYESLQCIFARGFHVLLILILSVSVFYAEKQRRIRYRKQFSKIDLKTNLNILKLSHRGRAEEVQRESSRFAAHQVSGSFNTLLTAALRMQEELKKICAEKKKENTTGGGGGEATEMSMSKEEEEAHLNLKICSEMIAEASNQFINLQTKTLIQRFENSTAVEGGGGGGGGELSTNSAHVHATKAILPPINNNSGNEDNTPRVLVVDDNKFCRQLLLDQVQSCFVPFCHVDGVGDSAPTALQHMLTSDVEYDLGNFFLLGNF